MKENKNNKEENIQGLIDRMIRQAEEAPMGIIKAGDNDQHTEENTEPEEGVI